jgi:hypothetical protein
MGQERRFDDVCEMSVVHPIASTKRTFRDGRKVPEVEVASSQFTLLPTLASISISSQLKFYLGHSVRQISHPNEQFSTCVDYPGRA